ncbi:FxsB family cyclophane-forming radical SAM/SPASM peptide maturase [Sphaerisporangium sp. TRM90804]|uniref:FxsB family cyclophane-forming radical SAM/SPASM peptide maturase n=1 Tax=Sphaerisporangium sp. TRM90804 TaxID=3031113 RepID=UPI00244B997E|nr:FxsB family cyclophane-forming radical SAM/SPASM peptide maturase [Sphaerisporangium sp. TRM90804]MDH2427494.1 FxsB family radical SAM/SPASM domain protein [Sphaerisporangium sp. TRM90804]
MRQNGNEWPETLDVRALISSGWRPAPFREYVLKINSRCDLACDYCYVYTMADQSWRGQPTRMSAETVGHVVRRIAEHASAHRLDSVHLILHGGEPLLAGRELLSLIAGRARSALRGITAVRISLQTNGVSLDAGNLRLLDELDIQVAVSLDGDVTAHDRHRRRPNGQGSHASVTAALRRLSSAPYRRLFRGLLCTVDLANDPVDAYQALLKFDPPAIDFLLPHGNWTEPPPGMVPGSGATPYADWLVRAFDRWYDTPVREVRVRLFEEVIHLLLDGTSPMEGLGLEPVAILVVETDGGVQQSDFLKSAYAGAAHTGLHVASDSFDEALVRPAFAARQIGAAALAATCRSCDIHRVCGAGLYAHRYRAGHGFANPSVYCADLYRFITHVRGRLAADIAGMRAR